jgi:hypothetical protein
MRSAPPERVGRLARYAASAPNGLPSWLEVLVAAHPTAVRDAWAPQIEAEIFAANPQPGGVRMLGRLTRSFQALRDAVAPLLCDLLARWNDVGPLALGYVLDAVMRTDLRDRLVEVAVAACTLLLSAGPLDRERFVSFWCFLLETRPEAAKPLLERAARELEADESRSLLESVCARLHGWQESVSPVRSNFLEDAATIGWFAPIVFDRVRVEDDIRHVGHYTPAARDDAQHLRGQFLPALQRITTTDADRALAELESDDRLVDQLDHIRDIIRVRERRLGSSSPMSEASAIEWIESGQGRIESPDDLHACALDVLEDIRLRTEEGDYSYRSLFSRAVESHVQLWLASELRRESHGRYSVTREEEVDDRKEPDIRLYDPAFVHMPVTIEVKLAERWSGNELVGGLRDQLVDQYLARAGSRHAVYVVCWCDKERRKSWDPDGHPGLDFRGLVALLETRAVEIQSSDERVERLDVVAIDFTRKGRGRRQ